MFGSRVICLGLLLSVVALSTGAEEVAATVEDEHVQTNVIPQSTQPDSPAGNLGFPGMGTALATGGAYGAVILVVGLLAALISQAFGVRLCTILGNCQDTTAYQAYSSNPVYGDYQGYQQGTYNNPVYQKRSLEYVGPILKMLGSAYEKYSRSIALNQQKVAK